jgi:2-polyprenyl-6-methoxyphenol hydroxylase-like FAD-dependent oxidoreductase
MIESTPQRPILIVGGGIGGLATAYALARKGAHVRVLEQASEFKEIGAGIQLGPNVWKMFDALGLTEAMRALAVFPENLIMMDCVTAQEVTRIDLGKTFLDRFKYPYALIHRADLHTTLLRTCENDPRIVLETSRKVVEIDDRGEGVRVKCEGGPSYEGAALIGCDGLWSTIRQFLVGDGKPRVSGHITYRAVLPTAEMPEQQRWQSMVIWAGEKTHLVHYPMRGGELFNLVAVFHSSRYEEGWDTYGDPAELHQRFSGTCQEVRTILEKIDSWKMWVLCDREPIRDWSKGRVTLLGDAAHPMLQYLAQGACMAIEDAVCLADKMEHAKGDFAAAFLAYQQARYVRTARVQLTARLYGEAYHAAGATRDLRNAVLSGRSQAQGMDSMGWLYDGIDPETGNTISV